MIRFADDFVLLTATRRKAEAAMTDCAGFLEKLRLHLHPLKTAIVESGAPFRFLGRWLNAPRLPAAVSRAA